MTLREPRYYIGRAKAFLTDMLADGSVEIDRDPEVRVDGDGKVRVAAWVVFRGCDNPIETVFEEETHE